MKKIIFLIFILFLMSGCNVIYEVDISKEGIKENIKIMAENELDNEFIASAQEPITAFYDSQVYSETLEKVPGVEYYNDYKEMNNGLYVYTLDYLFTHENFKKSKIINNAVSAFNITDNDGTFSYNVGSYIKAFLFQNEINNLKVQVNVSDDYEIVDTNASEVTNNTMVWNVTKNDYEYFPINFSLKDLNYVSKTNETKEENSIKNNLFIAFIGVIVFVIVLIILILYRKKINTGRRK